MKYMRRTGGYTWADYKKNSHIAKELEITPALDKLLEYKRNWIQHVNRMPRDRLPRIMNYLTYRHNIKRPYVCVGAPGGAVDGNSALQAGSSRV